MGCVCSWPYMGYMSIPRYAQNKATGVFFKLHIAYYTTSIPTKFNKQFSLHKYTPTIHTISHKHISECCGLGSRAFVEEQSMVSSQSLSTMDAATVEPIWTLEQGGFPDEARGRASGILARVDFFLQKLGVLLGTKIGDWLSFCPNFHVWDPYIALWFIIPILLGRKFVFSPMKKPSKPTHWRCWSIWRALDFPSQRPSNPWLGH